MPARSSAGMSRNIGRLGSTYQKVASAWTAMFSASGLACHSKIIPSTETSGSEATSAAVGGRRRPISEMAAIIAPGEQRLGDQRHISRASP